MLLREFVKETGVVRQTKTKFGYFKCDSCKNEFERPISERSKSNTDFCSRKCINFGRVQSEKQKKNLSNRMSGEGNHYFGCQHNSETRKLISNRVKETFQNDPSILMRVRELLKEKNKGIGNPFFGKTHTLEVRQKMSQTRVNLISTGKLSCGPRGRKGYYTSIKTGTNERYDSFFEFLRMKMLDNDDSVISWTKNHGIRIPYQFDNCQRQYVPDFLIHTSTKIFLEEIKGYENHEKLKAKIDVLYEYCHQHGFEARLIESNEFETLVRGYFGASIANLRKRLLK